MRRKFWLAVMLAWFSMELHAQPNTDKDDILRIVAVAMAQVGQGEWVTGLVSLKPYMTITAEEYEFLVDQRYFIELKAPQRYGTYSGTDFLALKEMGDSLMLLDYVEKFSHHMIRWRFYLYKPDNDWVINDLRINKRKEDIYTGV